MNKFKNRVEVCVYHADNKRRGMQVRCYLETDSSRAPEMATAYCEGDFAEERALLEARSRLKEVLSQVEMKLMRVTAALPDEERARRAKITDEAEASFWETV